MPTSRGKVDNFQGREIWLPKYVNLKILVPRQYLDEIRRFIHQNFVSGAEFLVYNGSKSWKCLGT